MKKTLSMILSALMLAGLATAAAADEAGVDYVVVQDVVDAADYKAFPDAYPYSTQAEGLAPVTTGELLKGTIIAGGTAEKNSTEGHNGSLAFDGDPKTYFEIFEITTRSYVGLVLDQAYELTEVRVTPASEQPTDRLHGLHIQGSNDGVTWVNVVAMRQDAHGKDSHIFTPYTVTDQAYIDAGYATRTDESIWWVGTGEAFSMYRVVNPSAGCQLSIGEVEFYGVAKEATNITAENINEYTPSTYYFPNHICVRDAEVVSVDGSLTGTVIGAGGSWNKALYEYAFDGNNKKAYDPAFRGPQCWVGLKLDEPHALTEVRILPKRGAYKNIATCLIQGSNDGINWVNLTQFTEEDIPAKQEWVTRAITDTNGYTYLRYVSDNSTHGDIADILFFGAPAAAGTVEAKVTPRSDLDVFNGEIVDTGAAVVSVDGSIAGTVIGAGQYYMWNDDSKWANGFDGDFATNFSNDQFGMAGWVGIKADAPTAVTAVRIAPTSNGFDNIEGMVAQGSNDGINWVTLAEFVEDDIPAEQTYVTKAIADTNAYTYFRITCKQYHNNAFAEAQFFAGEAPAADTPAETDAPETDAPETDAPETDAPATDTPASDEFHFYGELVDTGVKNVAPFGLENVVIGTVMGAGETPEANPYTAAFDGNIDTFWAATANAWATHMVVLKADAAVAPAAFTVTTQTAGDGNPIRFHALNGSRIQGSNDGITWETLFTFGEYEYVDWSELAAAGDKYYVCVPEEAITTAYTYFRYVNNDDGAAAIAEFTVLTAVPGAAGEEEKVSDEFHFYGELVDTGVKNVAPFDIENVVIGTVMGAGETPEGNEIVKAFDGDIDTFWAATANSWATHMIVLKADAPVVPTAFVVTTQTAGDGNPIRYHALNGSRIQGSNDGITWETLYLLGEFDYVDWSEVAAEGAKYYTLTPEEEITTAYTYFRYVNNDDGAAALAEFAVIAEGAADQGEAPQTFDAGVIAAAVAVISAAGYAIARKRK